MKLSIGELARRAEVSTRTIRFYVEIGLLPPPEGAGRVAAYTHEHLERLERIRELKELRLSLDEIRDTLSHSEVDAPGWKAQVVGSLKPAFRQKPRAAAASAADYLARLREHLGPTRHHIRSEPPHESAGYGAEPWLRIAIGPEVELHIRRRGSRMDPRLWKLVKEARRILAEEEKE